MFDASARLPGEGCCLRSDANISQLLPSGGARTVLDDQADNVGTKYFTTAKINHCKKAVGLCRGGKNDWIAIKIGVGLPAEGNQNIEIEQSSNEFKSGFDSR